MATIRVPCDSRRGDRINILRGLILLATPRTRTWILWGLSALLFAGNGLAHVTNDGKECEIP